MAAVLIAAAVLKGYQLATGPVPGSGLLSSRVFLIAVVEFEWLFGVWLLAGLCPKWTWRVTLGCFGLFACVSLYKGLSGEASCGCFGQVEISPWWTLTMDLAAVAALLRWAPRAAARNGDVGPYPFPSVRVVVIVAIAALTGFSCVFAMAAYRPAHLAADGTFSEEGEIVVVDPETWVGKPFPLADYIDVGDRFRRDQSILVFYHHDCPECHEILRRYTALSERLAQRPAGPRVALIEVPPYGKGSPNPLPKRCMSGRLSREKTWFLQTPLEVVVNQGQVVAVTQTADDMRRARFATERPLENTAGNRSRAAPCTFCQSQHPLAICVWPGSVLEQCNPKKQGSTFDVGARFPPFIAGGICAH